MVKIQLLYFEDCPSWRNGLENLKTALQKEQLDHFVELIMIKDDSDAARLKFLGSPSFRINNQDLWPEERDTYSLSCRVYITPEGMKGWPSMEMLRERLKVVKGDLQ
jgi:hypothetical protein